ncbi:hypothetical protein HYT58_02550 [Candidatus Woesearchaeota archaeon]|nr:hypothetical protein [Candidatus Woesearchaeota archaeon]
MTNFGKKITFKYRREIGAETRKVSEFLVIIPFIKLIFKNLNLYILVDTRRYLLERPYFNHKPIIIKTHAIKRAIEKGIAYPDHVYAVLKTGKVKRFGKNRIKFISRSEKGSIICVGEDLGQIIIIKTIERGN